MVTVTVTLPCIVKRHIHFTEMMKLISVIALAVCASASNSIHMNSASGKDFYLVAGEHVTRSGAAGICQSNGMKLAVLSHADLPLKPASENIASAGGEPSYASVCQKNPAVWFDGAASGRDLVPQGSSVDANVGDALESVHACLALYFCGGGSVAVPGEKCQAALPVLCQ